MHTPELSKDNESYMINTAARFGVFMIGINDWESYYLCLLASFTLDERRQFLKDAQEHKAQIEWAISVLPGLQDIYQRDVLSEEAPHGFLL